MKKLYLLVVLLLLVGCEGNSDASIIKIPVIDNNSTNDVNLITFEVNSTGNNNQPIEENNATNHSTPIIEENNSMSETTQTVEENNSTSTYIIPPPPSSTPIDNTPVIDTNEPIVYNKLLGKAQLGVLSHAKVKLYELNKVEKKLLATEFTSNGESIEGIGNFNLHLEKLKENRFYLYEVSGGEDYDVNDDGVIDNSATLNKGVFHLLVKGSHIKAIKKARITVISEIIYQKLLSSLNLENIAIENKMKLLVQEIIKEDINGDGFVGIEDILKYNPILDKGKLYLEYQNKIIKIIDDILKNKKSDLIAPIFKNENSTFEINENLELVGKIEIDEVSALTVTLLGDDADKLAYNMTTKELSLIKKVDFEKPHDKNSDNLFEFTIEAMDSYFNKTKKDFTIKILDINETIPKAPLLQKTTLSIFENNVSGTLVGSIFIKEQGTDQIQSFKISGEDAQFFTIDKEGKLFSSKSFDYETKKRYSLKTEATNDVGKSNQVTVVIQIEDVPDIKPTVQDVSLTVSENLPIGTLIGKIDIVNRGDSNISKIKLEGYLSNSFEIDKTSNIHVRSYLDYESYTFYYLQYRAINKAGESKPANLTVRISNVFENIGSDYPPTESGVQNALDRGDYAFVLNELLNNRDNYSGLDDDTVNMNIAGAYVGSSGYTVYDITGAMSDGNKSSFNDFVNKITKNNDPVATINQLTQADKYYSNIVQGLDCTNTTTLTQIEKDSCYNLGLVRLTSLTNSVKLLFGGNSNTVEKWAEGVEGNSSDDLNGNGVLDASEASACAIVYANNSGNSCQASTSYSYRGGVTFSNATNSHNFSLLEVDVGNATNGYQSFYQLVTTKSNNNTPVLTNGVCDKSFNKTTQPADGVTYFPCPTVDASGTPMGIKQSLESVANIQSLFPDGDETKGTLNSYITNITGDANGTIGLDNLSTYLRAN